MYRSIDKTVHVLGHVFECDHCAKESEPKEGEAETYPDGWVGTTVGTAFGNDERVFCGPACAVASLSQSPVTKVGVA
jgi:hypothetical protein